MVDDDINCFAVNTEIYDDHNNIVKYKALPVADFSKYFDLFQLCFEYASYLDPRVYCMRPELMSYAFSHFCDGFTMCSGNQIHIIALNIQKINNNGVSYLPFYDSYSEDWQLMLDALNSGLFPCLAGCISYLPGLSSSINFSNTLQERKDLWLKNLPRFDKLNAITIRRGLVKKLQVTGGSPVINFKKYKKLYNIKESKVNFKTDINFKNYCINK